MFELHYSVGRRGKCTMPHYKAIEIVSNPCIITVDSVHLQLVAFIIISSPCLLYISHPVTGVSL